jgi:NAD(P)-dependent dehydrogenase (short-subunit alcohol dehydrogenase family)
VAARFGRLDGLVNNAGLMLGRVPSLHEREEHVQAVIDLNVRSVVSMTRAAAPWLERKGGFVINTTSIAARNGGAGGAILYAAAKGFVSTLTRGHAKELIGKKIRVNAVAPGVIATPFHDRYTDSTAMEAAAQDNSARTRGDSRRMRRRLSVSRVGRPQRLHRRTDHRGQWRTVNALTCRARNMSRAPPFALGVGAEHTLAATRAYCRYCCMRVVRSPAKPYWSIETCQLRNSSTVSV